MEQLTYEQRFKIQEYLEINAINGTWFTQVALAEYVGTNQSTISRDLKKFRSRNWSYDARTAHRITKQKRASVNKQIHTKIIEWSKLAVYIEQHLQENPQNKKEGFWSPEQIAWRRRKDHPKEQSITHQTIYTYIYEHLPGLIKKYLKRHGKKYNYWKHKTNNKIPNRASIHDRPPEVEAKERLWDFEGDTIVWSNTWDRIVTCNDRRSWMLFADIILQQNSQSLAISTSVAMTKQLRDIETSKLKTMTLDNWVEFFDHEYIKEQLWIETYFADPYSSWQRGANENTNGLLRYFFPKWTDFSLIDVEYFRHAVRLINNRPRKRLWRKTPMEVFYK